MIILAIDTALKHCSVAIQKDGGIIFRRCELAASKQAELLPLMINNALTKSGIKPKEINKIAVTVGPGSFTGVRVGLAFAKGLALSAGSELLGISSFDAFVTQTRAISDNPKILCAINIAGSVFMTALDNEETALPPTRFEDYLALKDFSDYVICGYNFPKEIKENHVIVGDDFINPDILCQIAQSGTHDTFPPVPRYMRGADAKLWESKFPSHH